MHDIVVIGGSLGSTEALGEILSALPPDLPATVLVVTHLASGSAGYLPDHMRPLCKLPTCLAVEAQPLQPGQVIFAVPDRHLLIADHVLMLGRGPRENMARPAIDPLFRSAALVFGSRVIGVVLSGLLNDGASGLEAVKRMGGITIVQHPLDAHAAEMPRAALEATDVDHVAEAARIGALITTLVHSEPGPTPAPSPDLLLEVDIAAGQHLGSERLREIARPAALTCPHCQGVLSQMKGAGPLRYRCQIGHAFTAESLAATQADTVQEAIRIAMRLMEERVELVSRMAGDARRHGRFAVAGLYDSRAREYGGYAATLRQAATLSLQAGFDPGTEDA